MSIASPQSKLWRFWVHSEILPLIDYALFFSYRFEGLEYQDALNWSHSLEKYYDPQHSSRIKKNVQKSLKRMVKAIYDSL